MLDVRKPIGFLFLILGLTLVVYGFVQTPHQPTVFVLYGPEANYLNIPWGGMMTAFGVAMLLLSYLFDSDSAPPSDGGGEAHESATTAEQEEAGSSAPPTPDEDSSQSNA